ncbi:hypothetical protein GCM10010168_69870 [Actinoplanes ianthinogenes]|uniref:Uncharacterized protein n=1 Tax=Actinoplanes ianthinogenes TaxID=122358 RepID=A0ABM7M0T9_9ACTN|nr:hypothetical protein [Actinoplanes ianthinogenes]BCJ45186.1 hypothetical protein Aiant_58430 [Actinoplanes ianthinogenes]GGR41147.1 hypothetical protein GCM10010168_69870 [Actinoplanes ianthinogenes]
MTYPLARTRLEAQLYLEVTPCECGHLGLDARAEPVRFEDGTPGWRYAGVCAACGRDRVYVFRAPAVSQEVSTPDEVVYGLGGTSELLDPAQWLWVAQRYAAAVPSNSDSVPEAERATVRSWLMAAVAAVGEIEKFVPDDGDSVPASAFRTRGGQAWYQRDPHAFRADSLDDLRMGYERRLRAMRAGAPPRMSRERAARVTSANRIQEQWVERHGIDDEEWVEGGASGPRRRSPSPAQRAELTRLLREAAGLDERTGLSLDDPVAGLAAFRQLIGEVESRWAGDVPQRDRRLGVALSAYRAWLAAAGLSDEAWRDLLLSDRVWEVPRVALPAADGVWEMVRAARAAVA